MASVSDTVHQATKQPAQAGLQPVGQASSIKIEAKDVTKEFGGQNPSTHVNDFAFKIKHESCEAETKFALSYNEENIAAPMIVLQRLTAQMKAVFEDQAQKLSTDIEETQQQIEVLEHKIKGYSSFKKIKNISKFSDITRLKKQLEVTENKYNSIFNHKEYSVKRHLDGLMIILKTRSGQTVKLAVNRKVLGDTKKLRYTTDGSNFIEFTIDEFVYGFQNSVYSTLSKQKDLGIRTGYIAREAIKDPHQALPYSSSNEGNTSNSLSDLRAQQRQRDLFEMFQRQQQEQMKQDEQAAKLRQQVLSPQA